MDRIRARCHTNGDEGIAIIVAIALVSLVTTIMLVMLTYALRETGMSGRDRQRSAAVTAAEGQIDATFAKIQYVGRSAIPCGDLPVESSRQSPPDTMQVATHVDYYDAAGSRVPCADLGSVTLVTSKVTSVSTSNPLAGQPAVRRTMESLATLSPIFSQSSDKAIFGNNGVSLGNSATVNGSGGKPNANNYSNGPVTCADSGTQHGSLESQENILVKGSCTVDVDVHSSKGIILEGSVTVKGQVLAHGGDIDMGGTAVIGGARASGFIRWLPPRGCDGVPPCVEHTDVPAVPRYEFPVINFNRAEWEQAGYTVVDNQNDCSPAAGVTNNPSNWIQNHGNETGRTKIVLVTKCPIQYTNSITVVLSNDLAVFADGGFHFGNSGVFSNPKATPYLLHLIQPFSAAAQVCDSDIYDKGITVINSLTIGGVDAAQGVNAFMYTPCSINLGNSNTISGQIYAGNKVIIGNSLTLNYQAVPVAGNAIGESTDKSLVSYRLDVVYKRETR